MLILKIVPVFYDKNFKFDRNSFLGFYVELMLTVFAKCHSEVLIKIVQPADFDFTMTTTLSF